METKRQQFERETGKPAFFAVSSFGSQRIEFPEWEYVEWLEKQLEVRAISDEEIEALAKKAYPKTGIQFTDAVQDCAQSGFIKGAKALRDMNDRANGKEALRKELLAFIEANNWFSLEDAENAAGVVDAYLKVYKTIPTNKTE